MIDITIHLEADKLADAINMLAAAILGTPASKAEGTQFSLQPVRGTEAADPTEVAKIVKSRETTEPKAASFFEDPAPEPVPEPEAITTAQAAPAGPVITLEQVRKKMAEKAKTGAKAGEVLSTILARYGSAVLTKIDPAKYAALLAEVEAM